MIKVLHNEYTIIIVITVVDSSFISGTNKYKFVSPGAKSKIITLILALKLYELNDKNKDLLDDKTAETLAYWLANTVGTDVKNVIINDTDGKCIYNGNTSDGLGGVLTGGSTEYCNKLRNTIADNVTTLLIRCGYDDAQVGTDGIQFDMNKIENLTKE